MCFWRKKVKKQQQQQYKKSNIKNIAGAGDWTRELLHPKRMRYHCTAESTENTDCSQAISQFRRNGSKRKQTKPNLRARHFQQIHFFCNILHAWTTIFGSFSYLREYVSLLKYGLNIRCKQFWPKRYRSSIFIKWNRSSNTWWNVNLTLLFKDVHDAEKQWLKCNVRSDKIYLKQQYVAIWKWFDREVQRSKRTYWYNVQEKILSSLNNDQNEFWTNIGKMGIVSDCKKFILMQVLLASLKGLHWDLVVLHT